MTVVSILDYGVGNIGSVEKAIQHIGFTTTIASSVAHIQTAAILIVPGQGAAGDALQHLNIRNMIPEIQAHIASSKPYIGICLGFQLLFDSTEEDGGCPGLGIFEGTVKAFNPHQVKVPQMGWNTLSVQHDALQLFATIPAPIHAYFANSYYAVPTDESIVFTRTTHGISFVSAIQTPTVLGCQFHPEKSGETGLTLLKEFIRHHA